MGEAKRRQPRHTERSDGLPDFVFGRNRTAEREGEFMLAGRLVTDIPKDDPEGFKRDEAFIKHMVGTLLDEVKHDPDLQEAGFWRIRTPPADRRID